MFVVLPVALLVGVEVDAGVVVLDGVAVLVDGGGLLHKAIAELRPVFWFHSILSSQTL